MADKQKPVNLSDTLPKILNLLKTDSLSETERKQWEATLRGVVDRWDKLRDKAKRLGDLLTEFDQFADTIDTARQTGAKIGPVTGFPKIDSELCHCLQPGLHVVTGNTGSGKTAFCLQVACQCGFPALYVGCEQSSLELFRRVIARETETALHEFKNPRLKHALYDAAAMKGLARKAAANVPNLVIADSTLAFWDRQAIVQETRILRDATEAEHVLIVIDSIHSWARWIDADEYERLSVAVQKLQQTAAELACPVVYISEQSKTANRENAKGKDLGASAPAGNRGIEYGAETVIGLRAGCDKEGRPVTDACGKTPVTATLHKNRNGAPGKPIKMAFDGALMRFEEV